MSYRLIDSNAIAIKYPEVNEMPCVYADLPDGLNGQFIDAQPEPSQVARDIATIIENEKDMRVIASAQPDLDEWCTDCKEYDHERHCCPRWNRVIREAVEEAKQPEIIHCRDCKYSSRDMGGKDIYCLRSSSYPWHEDSFCSDAERREEHD